jgi:hypothetical protein
MVRTLRNLLHELAIGFCTLNRIQFDAPWNPRRGC